MFRSRWGARQQAVIWHVDETAHICRMVQANFERLGCQVRTFTSVSELREALADDKEPLKPDVLVIELAMAEGWEVVKQIKSDSEMCDRIAFMALTQMARDADVFRGWQSGIDCYLTKPINPNEVITFAKRLLDGIAGKTERILL